MTRKAARQRVRSMTEFARAMLDTSDAFAARVRTFAEQFGSADDDTLGVLAQTAFFCWFEVEYKRDFLEACRAIGTGKPTSLYLCRQTSPARWNEMHAYVVGVRRWLGMDRPVPAQIDAGKVARISVWLGPREPVKEALAAMFVGQLVARLRSCELAMLGGDVAPAAEPYSDYSAWYACHGREDSALSDANDDVRGVIEGIRHVSQPPCMHRFSRHMDIQVASIGALEWRGNLPPEDEPKMAAAQWLDGAGDAVRAWVKGRPPEDDTGRQIHELLGESTGRRKAIARDFLLTPPPGAGFFDWLDSSAERAGAHADAIFDERLTSRSETGGTG